MGQGTSRANSFEFLGTGCTVLQLAIRGRNPLLGAPHLRLLSELYSSTSRKPVASPLRFRYMSP